MMISLYLKVKEGSYRGTVVKIIEQLSGGLKASMGYLVIRI